MLYLSLGVRGTRLARQLARACFKPFRKAPRRCPSHQLARGLSRTAALSCPAHCKAVTAGGSSARERGGGGHATPGGMRRRGEAERNGAGMLGARSHAALRAPPLCTCAPAPASSPAVLLAHFPGLRSHGRQRSDFATVLRSFDDNM